jgi:D-tagatose-bisphosphate aldolase class II non-catalytic subunit
MRDILRDLRADHLAGRRKGLASICSAHPEVLAAAMHAVLAGPGTLLVEATANQVNQYGGYTGLTPEAFAAGLRRLAAAAGFPAERLTVGADHLGPYAWRAEPAERAMGRCEELIGHCVRAGFRKLHLDTGFGCADDPAPVVPLDSAVARAVRLCRAAEAAVAQGQPRPCYVVGAEVPPPGGDLAGAGPPAVTPVGELEEVLRRFRAGFGAAGLEWAWERVLAVVVQPGVEFGDDGVAVYRPGRAAALAAFHSRLPGVMTYEIHSTDYQPAEALARLTADHFTLLKVGPCLTHAYHQAVLALEGLEQEWLGGRTGCERSGVAAALEAAMLADPAHWRAHYRGSPAEILRLRRESLRDRARYYWGAPGVQQALERLHRNLHGPLPDRLVERFFPGLALPEGPPAAAALVRARVQAALKPYLEATS